MISTFIRISLIVLLLIAPFINIKNENITLGLEQTSITAFSIDKDIKVTFPSVPKLVNEKHKPPLVHHQHFLNVNEVIFLEKTSEHVVDIIPQKMSFLYEVKYQSNFFS